MPDALEALCDDVLVRSLRQNSPGLVAALDRWIAHGHSRAELLRRCLLVCGGRRDSFTFLAVEAYLGANQEGEVRP